MPCGKVVGQPLACPLAKIMGLVEWSKVASSAPQAGVETVSTTAVLCDTMTTSPSRFATIRSYYSVDEN